MLEETVSCVPLPLSKAEVRLSFRVAMYKCGVLRFHRSGYKNVEVKMNNLPEMATRFLAETGFRCGEI